MTEALVEVVRLPHAEGLALPAYASAGAAAMDLLAAVAEPLVLAPGGRAAIPTGLMVALPAGHELQIRPRSGLALNQGVLVANAPGTIDEDYRGEIKVILMNGGTEPVVVTRGMRIAQAVLAPVDADRLARGLDARRNGARRGRLRLHGRLAAHW